MSTGKRTKRVSSDGATSGATSKKQKPEKAASMSSSDGMDLLPFDIQCPCCFRPGTRAKPFCSDFKGKASERLVALRLMMKIYNVDAYLIPSEDAHSSEYVSSADERRSFITGFTGSAGAALVTATEALCFTDARYFLQAGQQLGDGWKLMKMHTPGVPQMSEWLAENLRSGMRIGLDPQLFAYDTVKQWEEKDWNPKGLLVVPIENNLVDQVWLDRPQDPCNAIAIHPLSLAGEDVATKVARVRAEMSKLGKAEWKGKGKPLVGALVLNALDQIAWVYNLRGSDIECNPVFFAYTVITPTTAYLYIRLLDAPKGKNQAERQAQQQANDACVATLRAHLDPAGVQLRAYGDFMKDMGQLPSLVLQAQARQAALEAGGEGGTEGQDQQKARRDMATTVALVMVEKGSCNLAMVSGVRACSTKGQGQVHVLGVDFSPPEVFKAQKNEAEREGIRKASVRDSLAICRYFSWLRHTLVQEGKQDLNEAMAADVMHNFRVGGAAEGKSGEAKAQAEEELKCVGDSFPTISSAGANGAVIHYHASHEDPDVALLATGAGGKGMYLCDTGGQYLDGTTDITRTLHFASTGAGEEGGGGGPTAEQKRCYTRVLQCHIALAQAVFPAGTPGLMLEMHARGKLWQDGLNYGHGTGHGIGAYLNVHEGPMGIGGGTVSGERIKQSERMQRYYLYPLQEGHYLSNEPGFYKDGEFGIRIESDMLVVPAEGLPFSFGPRPYLRFEYVTKVPMCSALVDAALLTAEERHWLDAYHVDVRATLLPLLEGTGTEADKRAAEWLIKATCTLG